MPWRVNGMSPGTVLAAAIFAIIAAIYLCFLARMRSRIVLTASLIAQSIRVIQAHPGGQPRTLLTSPGSPCAWRRCRSARGW